MFKTSEQINELADALVKAQSVMENASKSDKGNWGKYANFTKVIKASRQALTSNGLSVAQPIGTSDSGTNYITTVLLHKSGQYMMSVFFLSPAKPGRDQLGSEVTYWKRQCYKSMVGVVDEEEQDYDNAPRITEKQAKDIISIIDTNFENPKKVTAWLLEGYCIDKITDMYAADYNNACDLLVAELEKQVTLKR